VNNGVLVFNANGSYSYTPNQTSTAPTASLLRGTDGSRHSTPATVTITVNAVNDVPVVHERDARACRKAASSTSGPAALNGATRCRWRSDHRGLRS